MLASRPKTLTGAAVPVMIGLAFAARDLGLDDFGWMPALLCVLFAFIMQIDANFINDYFDFVRGNDDETRLGPRRACAQGWITPKAMRRAIIITTVIACCIGLPLVIYGGLEMILVGAFCVVFCFLYTTLLSYLGLGDVLVLVFSALFPCVLPIISRPTDLRLRFYSLVGLRLCHRHFVACQQLSRHRQRCKGRQEDAHC